MNNVLLVAVFYGCVSLATSEALTNVSAMCSEGQTCFSLPKNCKEEDCQFILSVGADAMHFYTRNTNFNIYNALYTKKEGVRSKVCLLCFPGTTKCFWGSTKLDEPMVMRQRIRIEYFEVDEVDGDFIYTFPKNYLTIGKDIKVFFTRGVIKADLALEEGKELFPWGKTVDVPEITGEDSTQTEDEPADPMPEMFKNIKPEEEEIFGGKVSTTIERDQFDSLVWNRLTEKGAEIRASIVSFFASDPSDADNSSAQVPTPRAVHEAL